MSENDKRENDKIMLNAVAIAEQWDGYEDVTEEEYFAAWQHLIDSGICWQLQGWFGRTAIEMVESGHCKPSQFMIDRGLVEEISFEDEITETMDKE